MLTCRNKNIGSRYCGETDFVDDGECLSNSGDNNEELECKDSNQSILGKRIRYKYYVRLPRVLKRDIRRQYPLMVGNVMNNHDLSHLQSFLQTFSANEVFFELKNTASTLGIECSDRFEHLFRQDVPEVLNYRGYQWIFYYWHVLTALSPDHIVRIHNSQIISRSDSSRSKVAMDISVDFTRMYDIQFLYFLVSIFNKMAEHLQRDGQSNATVGLKLDPALLPPHIAAQTATPLTFGAISQSLDTSGTSEATLAATAEPPDPFSFYSSLAGEQMPLLSKPQPMTMKMRFILHLNEEKAIETLEACDILLTTHSLTTSYNSPSLSSSIANE